VSAVVAPSAPWPRAAVVGLLTALAVAVGAQEVLRPAWTGHAAPAVLGVATLAVGLVVFRHSRRLDALSTVTWRGFAAVAVLLALGQGIRAASGAGMNPLSSGPSDLALAATGPVAVLICVRLVRSTGGRIRAQVVLDAAVALTALAVLLEVLVPVATRASAGAADHLLTVGYPAVAAVLCAVGLVTLAGVSAPRRAAAGWLLACFASLAVAMVSGALAVGMPSATLDVVTSTAYLAMVATATMALSTDPGAQAGTDQPAVAVALAGVVVGYCLSFGVLLLLLGGLAAGRDITTPEAVTVALLMSLTFVRTLVWAADGARLTRQVLRTEAYFRTLVHRAADLTLVLDDRGQVTWASGPPEGRSTWAPRDLEGRPLRDLVHGDDRHELHSALDAAGVDDGRGPVFRLRMRDGSWRRFETLRTASSAGFPDAPAGMSAQGRAAGTRDGLVLHLRDVAGQRTAELELERLAYTDYLTGLPNRARLMAALTAARSRAALGEQACLLLLDLDGFKPVNDIAGHEAGDHLLVQVAARLRNTVRDGDLVGRLGGDEFAVLVRDGMDEAAALAERIVADLRTVHASAPAGGPAAGLLFDVSGSIGVTELDPADDVSTTIRQADLALRAAKAAGKNCVRSSGQAIDSAMGRRTRLARDLPAALEQGQFRVVYQPIVGVQERRIVGLEALVRWDHPVLGTVPPVEFVSLAEDDGLIVPLQRQVLQRSMTDLARLTAAGWTLQMGVNVSVRHLQAGCLAPDVAHALASAGVPPRQLVLEITESVLLDAEDRLESDLATLQDMGCVISLDDFGRGYSSLAYLARLPVDILKMDRQFIADIETDRRGAALVASVIDLGRTLEMDVLAEGVETAGQLAALRAMGIRYVQGYLLGRPVELSELVVLLETFDPALLDGSREPQMDTDVHMVGQGG
jgi:diguanylate cyclase (GGDEF)-like protein/PAS domain S-box-containing protein